MKHFRYKATITPDRHGHTKSTGKIQVNDSFTIEDAETFIRNEYSPNLKHNDTLTVWEV